jgi:hypothetical protein
MAKKKLNQIGKDEKNQIDYSSLLIETRNS